MKYIQKDISEEALKAFEMLKLMQVPSRCAECHVGNILHIQMPKNGQQMIKSAACKEWYHADCAGPPNKVLNKSV